MDFKLSHIVAFFLSTAMCAVLLIPTGLDRALIYKNSFMYDRALAQLDRLASGRPAADSVLVSERLDNLYRSGRYQETAQLLEDQIRRNPDDSVALLRLARTYITTMEPEEAIRTFEKLIEITPSDSEALYQLDSYYYGLQQAEPRITNLLRLVRYYPGDLANWEALTELYLDTGRSEEALHTLEKAAVQFPDSLQLALRLGSLLVYENRDGAYEFIDQLRRRHPEDDDIFRLMVQALLNRGDYLKALEQARQYGQGRFTPEEYRTYLAGLIEQIPDRQIVIRFLEQQAGDNPAPETRFWLARLFEYEGRYAEAREQLRQVVRERPDEKSYWELYLPLLWEERDKKELLAALEEFCRRWPDEREYRLRLAQAYEWNGEYEPEVETLRGLVAEDPSRTGYTVMLAQALNNLGRHESAAELLDALAAAHPDSARFRQALRETVQALPDGAVKTGYLVKLYSSAGGADSEIAFLLAADAARAGKTVEVERILQKIFALHGGEAAMLVRAGELCRLSGMAEPAAGYYRQALAVDPDNETALIGQAELAAAGEPAVARAALERLERRPVNAVELAWRVAQVYDAIADQGGAARAYARYLSLADRRSTDSYALRRQAWALFRSGQSGPALALYQRLVRDFPGDRDLANDYAEVLIADKQYDKALLELDKVKP